MLNALLKEKVALLIILLFAFFASLWLYMALSPSEPDSFHSLYAWGYGSVALVGGIFGLFTASKWGGFKSMLGKAVFFFSIGLLLQEFGQLSFTYYTQLQGVEAPYPSIAEIGFLGYLPFYLLGMWYLGQIAGVRVSLRTWSSRLIALSVFVVMLTATYFVFLRLYTPDWSNVYVTLVDYGYSIGQAVNVSVMIVAYLLSRKLLGGLMRTRLLFVMAAYFMQFLSDFTFLYTFYYEAYSESGVIDLMYLFAYFLMAMALVSLKTGADKIGEGKKDK